MDRDPYVSKGNRKKCKNYSGISVISIMDRFYGTLIKIKLEDNIKNKKRED